MDARQTDPGKDGVADDASTDGRHPVVDLPWSRVALLVGAVVVVGAVALQLYGEASLNPREPYGNGTVTIAGQTHDADVCESMENGVEVTYGSQDAVLYVFHMGPPEIYEDLEVKPRRMDGTFFVQRTDEGEQWSRAATLVEQAPDGITYEAAFEAGEGPVTVTIERDPGGWCHGADPNVWWR